MEDYDKGFDQGVEHVDERWSEETEQALLVKLKALIKEKEVTWESSKIQAHPFGYGKTCGMAARIKSMLTSLWEKEVQDFPNEDFNPAN